MKNYPVCNELTADFFIFIASSRRRKRREVVQYCATGDQLGMSVENVRFCYFYPQPLNITQTCPCNILQYFKAVKMIIFR